MLQHLIAHRQAETVITRDAGPLPSACATYLVRFLLLRLMLGMSKLKFSRGWARPSNRMYIKWFMSWQPLPTELSWRLFHLLPDAAFQVLYFWM